MLGGVTVNFILGFLIYGFVLFNWGENVLPTENVKYGMYADSFAMEMGFRTGDELVSIDNKPVDNFNAIRLEIFKNESKNAQVIRDGDQVSFDIPENLTGKLASYKGAFVVPRYPFVIDEMLPDYPGEKTELKKGDKLIGLNDIATPYYDNFATEIKQYKSEEVTVHALRGKDTLSVKVALDEKAAIGALPQSMDNFLDIVHKDYSFGEAMPAGTRRSVEFLSLQVNAFGQMFTGKVKASESLGGFGSIAKMFSPTWDWQRFWRMTAVLSLILAFMNLLPIPALDGGHVMFLLYEMITGRKPSDKFLEYATIAGFALILGLVLYANGLDILRWFRGE
jgi:regulator of sigma E protease